MRKVRRLRTQEEEKHLLPDMILPAVETIKSHIPKTIPKPHLPKLRKT